MLRDYWRESRRPLVSLVFISPLLVVYEVGVLRLGPAAMRNGAAEWMKSILQSLGFGQYFLLPLLTVGLLLGWHHVTRDRWYVPQHVLYGMAGECTSLALMLVAIAYIQAAILGSITQFAAIDAWSPLGNVITRLFGKAIGFCGAGLYEELLFRLILLTGLISAFHLIGATPLRAAGAAVAVSSLLFSLAHYVGPQGDSFTVFSCLFRFVAGTFFAILFLKRGFGIAAGTHALYDIIVGLL